MQAHEARSRLSKLTRETLREVVDDRVIVEVVLGRRVGIRLNLDVPLRLELLDGHGCRALGDSAGIGSVVWDGDAVHKGLDVGDPADKEAGDLVACVELEGVREALRYKGGKKIDSLFSTTCRRSCHPCSATLLAPVYPDIR